MITVVILREKSLPSSVWTVVFPCEHHHPKSWSLTSRKGRVSSCVEWPLVWFQEVVADTAD